MKFVRHFPEFSIQRILFERDFSNLPGVKPSGVVSVTDEPVNEYGEWLYLAAANLHSLASSGSPLIVSVAGAQGSGKSTFAIILGDLLHQCFHRSSVILSLDDFYLTRSERGALSRDIHPNLQVRGVPGTHAVGLMLEVLDCLERGDAVHVPVFSKAIDDRLTTSRLIPAADIIIVEGWCWGARPQSLEQLEHSVNDLEKVTDPAGEWRGFVNAQLASDYAQLFRSDVTIFLQVPSIESVINWRWQQEQQLTDNPPAEGQVDRKMTSVEEVAVFVAYYERLTRWMLHDIPEHADLTLRLDDQHRLSYGKENDVAG